jgi:hypothetical protein
MLPRMLYACLQEVPGSNFCHIIHFPNVCIENSRLHKEKEWNVYAMHYHILLHPFHFNTIYSSFKNAVSTVRFIQHLMTGIITTYGEYKD